jgi:hypothetical protein
MSAASEAIWRKVIEAAKSTSSSAKIADARFQSLQVFAKAALKRRMEEKDSGAAAGAGGAGAGAGGPKKHDPTSYAVVLCCPVPCFVVVSSSLVVFVYCVAA